MEFSITFANVVYKTRVGVSPSNRNTLLNTPHTVNVCFACACQKNLPSISIGLSLSFSLFLFLSLSLSHMPAPILPPLFQRLLYARALSLLTIPVLLKIEWFRSANRHRTERFDQTMMTVSQQRVHFTESPSRQSA